MCKRLYIKGYVIQQDKTRKGYIRLCNMARMLDDRAVLGMPIDILVASDECKCSILHNTMLGY